MKIRSLKNYGIPSFTLDIWKENCFTYLLPLQEEAVRNYGVLDCDDNQNLLVIAPPSSGKSFLGEMAAIAHLIHQKKCIYLAPFRFSAEEKYYHFKNLYSKCGFGTIISTRNRKVDDNRIIQGDYQLAVMDCEKFNYFLLMYPEFLTDVSLVIIDEMQIIDDPKWGPLLEEIIDHLLKKNLISLRIIALSAHVENQDILLEWFPAHPLISYPQPVEIRKGVVREGVFKYTTSKKKKAYRREIFFKPDTVRDNCFEDYLLETVRYFIKKDEPTLVFFATPEESRQYAGWLASRLESPAASSAIKELHQMEDTLSRNKLLEVLEKGVTYHNPDLSWEEKNLVETHLKKGEIKIVCAATKYSIGINLPFKNIIIPFDKIHNHDGNYLHNHRTSLGFADIQNMGRRAGNKNFGRIIFLAHSLLSETVHQNTYFNFTGSTKHKTINKQLIKGEKELLTYLLRLAVKHKLKPNEIKEYVKKEATHLSGYWHFSFDKENIEKKIDRSLNILKQNKLIREIKGGILSPTDNGILITAIKIKVETYLFLKKWIEYSIKGEISDLEILLLFAFSADGKALPIPFFPSYRDDDHRGNYQNKLRHLVLKEGEEDKKLYQDKIMSKKIKEDSLTLEDHLAFKKTCLLHDWIKGDMDIKTIEQENGVYGGVIQVLGESFSWLVDSLMEIAQNEGWRKKRKEDLDNIKILSKRLIGDVGEDGLNLSQLHIPGLNRDYVRRAVLSSSSTKNYRPNTRNPKLVARNLPPTALPSPSKTENQELKTVLQIDKYLPGRIIFEEKEVEVTAKEFSLIYLLSQNRGKTITYRDLLKTLWTENEYSTYVQITSHLYKIRRAILKTIGNNKKNNKRVKDILKVVSRRGIMLNLEEDKLKIN